MKKKIYIFIFFFLKKILFGNLFNYMKYISFFHIFF